jgi:hypothetical protein
MITDRRQSPQDTLLLADRGHVLSRLTFPSENRHRAGHMGRLRTATLTDVDGCRRGFGLRDGLLTPVGGSRNPAGTVFWCAQRGCCAPALGRLRQLRPP